MTKPSSLQRLLSSISELRKEGKFTDLSFTHERGTFRVHRIIVCPQSKVFRKACDGGFKEQSEGLIKLGHVPYEHLARMVEFFYHMDYSEKLPEGTQESTLGLHAQMFALADQYEIPALLSMSEAKYSERCVKAWEPLDFLSSVSAIWESTPTAVQGLRNTACVAVRRHLPDMLEDSSTAERFKNTLSECSVFARDLLDSYIKNPLFGYCQMCRSDHGMEPLPAR
ncbi:hypothetical protein PMIN02_005289 [Paraphaeosphaeria minitans]